jgi:hypothetical protein
MAWCTFFIIPLLVESSSESFWTCWRTSKKNTEIGVNSFRWKKSVGLPYNVAKKKSCIGNSWYTPPPWQSIWIKTSEHQESCYMFTSMVGRCLLLFRYLAFPSRSHVRLLAFCGGRSLYLPTRSDWACTIQVPSTYKNHKSHNSRWRIPLVHRTRQFLRPDHFFRAPCQWSTNEITRF